MYNYSITLEKDAGKRLTEEKVKAQLDSIVTRVHASGRQNKGWTAKINRVQMQGTGPYKYIAFFDVACTPKTPRTTIEQEWSNIVGIVKNAGNAPKWKVISVNGKAVGNGDTDGPIDAGRFVGYSPVEIPDDWAESFEHIYDRQAQIDIIISAVQASIDSQWFHRFHVCLYGEPASGKTEIMRSVKNMVGEHAILEMDATATTQAGAIKELNERDELPRILLIEEIEKADDGSLRWLLGVLDYRGEVRKLTARTAIQKDVKMLCIATVNDMDKFRSNMSGALASRFAHQLHCPRPSKELLKRILKREVDRVGGKEAWIEPAIEYAFNMNVNDPRRILAICLCGKDELLGSKKFQKKLDAVKGIPTAV